MNALDRFQAIWFELYSRSDYRSVCEIYGLDPNAHFSGKSQKEAFEIVDILPQAVFALPKIGGN